MYLKLIPPKNERSQLLLLVRLGKLGLWLSMSENPPGHYFNFIYNVLFGKEIGRIILPLNLGGVSVLKKKGYRCEQPLFYRGVLLSIFFSHTIIM